MRFTNSTEQLAVVVDENSSTRYLTKAAYINYKLESLWSRIIWGVFGHTQFKSKENESLYTESTTLLEYGFLDSLVRKVASSASVLYINDTDVIRLALPNEFVKANDLLRANKPLPTGWLFFNAKNFRRLNLSLKDIIARQFLIEETEDLQLTASSGGILKIADLRKLTQNNSKEDIESQAKKVVDALANGRKVMIDAADEYVNEEGSSSATNAIKEANANAIDELSQELGLPTFFFTGELDNGGLFSGEIKELKVLLEALNYYYLRIVGPCLRKLFPKEKITYGLSMVEKISEVNEITNILESSTEFFEPIKKDVYDYLYKYILGDNFKESTFNKDKVANTINKELK
jgi:predicted DNA-binding protein (UPF0251 family)